jgi:hypothetical protein
MFIKGKLRASKSFNKLKHNLQESVQKHHFQNTNSNTLNMIGSTLLLLALSAISNAKELQMLIFQTSGVTLDLGGTSTQQSAGMLYRIDGGDWKELDTYNKPSVCSKLCDSGSYLTFSIPELDGNTVNVCEKLSGNESECLAGSSYTCQFSYGTIVSTYQSTKDVSPYGIGYETGTYCGGAVVDVN